jgi:hypothetical protein
MAATWKCNACGEQALYRLFGALHYISCDECLPKFKRMCPYVQVQSLERAGMAMTPTDQWNLFQMLAAKVMHKYGQSVAKQWSSLTVQERSVFVVDDSQSELEIRRLFSQPTQGEAACESEPSKRPKTDCELGSSAESSGIEPSMRVMMASLTQGIATTMQESLKTALQDTLTKVARDSEERCEKRFARILPPQAAPCDQPAVPTSAEESRRPKRQRSLTPSATNATKGKKTKPKVGRKRKLPFSPTEPASPLVTESEASDVRSNSAPTDGAEDANLTSHE